MPTPPKRIPPSAPHADALPWMGAKERTGAIGKRNRTDISAPIAHSAPTPVSGERVMVTPERSTFRKPYKPKNKGADTRAIGRATDKRQTWEASEAGQARTTDVSAHLQQQHGVTMAPGEFYSLARSTGHLQESSVGPAHWDVQLPGMADPSAAPRPERWEEMSHEQQQHTHVALAKLGTSLDQMVSDIGAQHDQAVLRAMGQGHTKPYASDFYSTGEPRQVLDQSAREMGIPQTIHAQMNAFTSPNTKFSHNLKTGETIYPNDTAAKHAIIHSQMGGDPAELVENPQAREMRRTGLADPSDTRRVQGYAANAEKASQAMHQHMAGVAPADWRTGRGAGPMGDATKVVGGKEKAIGGSPWRNSPKTGPYANSWSDTHPQFFVSDIHSGGGGALPHLSSFKGVTGKKSERERGIEKVPGFHSVVDYAARQAMTQRGVRSLRDFQAGQWGEEQLQRRSEAVAKGNSPGSFPTEAQAYPGTSVTKRETPGQESLF